MRKPFEPLAGDHSIARGDESFVICLELSKANAAVAQDKAECERLRRELSISLAFASEAKRKWAPDTTNSIVDEWLKQVNAALEEKKP